MTIAAKIEALEDRVAKLERIVRALAPDTIMYAEKDERDRQRFASYTAMSKISDDAERERLFISMPLGDRREAVLFLASCAGAFVAGFSGEARAEFTRWASASTRAALEAETSSIPQYVRVVRRPDCRVRHTPRVVVDEAIACAFTEVGLRKMVVETRDDDRRTVFAYDGTQLDAGVVYTEPQAALLQRTDKALRELIAAGEVQVVPLPPERCRAIARGT